MKQCIWSCLELIIYTFHCNNFQFNYWALSCYAYVVIFHLYLTLMFIDEDGFCYFIPLNAFRDYLQQSTSPIFSSFMDLQALEEISSGLLFLSWFWLECCQMVHQLFVMPRVGCSFAWSILIMGCLDDLTMCF